MIAMKTFSQYFSIGLFVLIIMLSAKRNEHHLIWIFNESFRSRTILRGNFTCETWKTISYIDKAKYRECLQLPSNGRFWGVQELRHTAHKHLFNSSSLIVEVGGNRAHDTVKFIEFHNPWIISFEPLASMSKDLTNRFKFNPKVEIRPYGLGNRARRVFVERNDHGNAGTSVYRKFSSPNSTRIERIELLDVVEVIQEIRRTRSKHGMIDMISINCEGCEFEIIPALILNNLTQYFRVIQFASHINLVPHASCIYCQIEQALERTHKKLFYFSKLWEGWVLNK